MNFLKNLNVDNLDKMFKRFPLYSQERKKNH